MGTEGYELSESALKLENEQLHQKITELDSNIERLKMELESEKEAVRSYVDELDEQRNESWEALNGIVSDGDTSQISSKEISIRHDADQIELLFSLERSFIAGDRFTIARHPKVPDDVRTAYTDATHLRRALNHLLSTDHSGKDNGCIECRHIMHIVERGFKGTCHEEFLENQLRDRVYDIKQLAAQVADAGYEGRELRQSTFAVLRENRDVIPNFVIRELEAALNGQRISPIGFDEAKRMVWELWPALEGQEEVESLALVGDIVSQRRDHKGIRFAVVFRHKFASWTPSEMHKRSEEVMACLPQWNNEITDRNGKSWYPELLIWIDGGLMRLMHDGEGGMFVDETREFDEPFFPISKNDRVANMVGQRS